MPVDSRRISSSSSFDILIVLKVFSNKRTQEASHQLKRHNLHPNCGNKSATAQTSIVTNKKYRWRQACRHRPLMTAIAAVHGLSREQKLSVDRPCRPLGRAPEAGSRVGLLGAVVTVLSTVVYNYQGTAR